MTTINSFYQLPQNRIFKISTVSAVYTIKNCTNKEHAIEKMVASMLGFKEADIVSILEV